MAFSKKAFFDGFGTISLFILMKMLPALVKCIVIVYSTTAEM